MTRKLWLPFVVIVLVIVAGRAEAQNLRFGIKGGLVMAGVSSSTELLAPFESVRALGGGLAVEMPLQGSVSVQAEALYLRRNTKATLLGADLHTIVDYLEVPVMLKIYGGDAGSGSYRLYLLAGGAVGLRLSATGETRVAGEVLDQTDIKDEIKSIGIGLPIALGVSFGGRFDLEARYTIGLSDFDNDGNGLRWRTWTLMAGINF